MVQGVVEQANDRGIKVGGLWFNYSQFQEVPHPEVGDTVTMEVVRDRFIRALKIDGADESEELTGDDFAGLQPPAPDGDDPSTWGGPSRYPQGQGPYPAGTAAPRRVAPHPEAPGAVREDLTNAPRQAARPPQQPHGEAFLARAEGLKAAITFTAGTAEPTVEATLAVADVFARYLLTGEAGRPLEEGGT
jgi:hypothetical protein